MNIEKIVYKITEGTKLSRKENDYFLEFDFSYRESNKEYDSISDRAKAIITYISGVRAGV